MNELQQLANYIAAGGVVDDEGVMCWNGRDAEAVMNRLSVQHDDYETLLSRYAENPQACVSVMRSLGRVH